MQIEKYIGLKYKEKGRDFDGVDCWGLARLFYKNELNIDLPSFSSEYTQTDVQRIEELIAQYKEGWEQIEQPEEGSIVLFRVLGSESHVGIIVNNEQFLHVRENQDSAIENFSSPFWKKRIVGYFKYSIKKNAVLNAVPHPLRTERYTMPVLPGTTLSALVNGLTKEYNIPEELKSKISVILNGKVVDSQLWENTILKEGDAVEYRAVPKGSVGRMIAMIAIMYIAIQTGYWAAGQVGWAEGTAMTAAQATAYGTTVMATTMVGTSLLNAIAPIRQDSSNGNDPGSAERQLMVDGGSNATAPYSAIPVVLGKVRVTPRLGSVNYLTYENDRDSYLSMLLVWGYGPLSIDQNTMRIGNNPISNYTDKQIVTFDRITEPTSDQKQAFDAIYGKDVTSVQVATELVCDGNPESTVTPGPWLQASTSESANRLTIALHFPQGLRKVKIKGEGSGDSAPTTVSFRVETSTNGTTWNLQDQITVGGDAVKKDAFTTTRSYQFLNNTQLFVRVRRETGDNTEDNPDYRYYHSSIFQNATFVRNASPAEDPLGAKIAKTAIKIKATDQLNGRIEGINAVVQTYCKTWNGTTWVDGATSNPAALFRYILEHPANPRKITNAATQINLTQLQYFHQYCASKGFEYNAILGEQRSILDVLRDICAAGRASPALIDGKWTVLIDEERSNVVQHFTPHNSWGFEGTKALPKRPDGLRITYFDQDKEYQEVETIVYDVDKTDTNAALFESISLPGVTKSSLVIDHAKWHMAQMKLRPEVYTLNVDIEYLVCNRGDRVKVLHDVPMWGLGSGRIKNVISSTKLQLDEQIPMVANTNYTIRIRSKTGTSTVRTVVAKPQDGNYSEIDLTTSITSSEVDVNDLFLFGQLNSEAADLIVLSIEPTNTKSARLTLVDYGVTQTYNLFTQYQSLSNSIVFESKVTLPPVLQIDGFNSKIPTMTGFVSDESVMERISSGIYRYNINIGYVNALDLPTSTEFVEVQYDRSSASDTLNSKSFRVPYQKGSVQIVDVAEGETYKIRMRYVTEDGRTGKWTSYSNHTVVGKTNPPSQVTSFVVGSDKSSGQLVLKWQPNPELDVVDYEVRLTNSGWGTNDNNRVFHGNASTCFVKYTGSAVYYVKAIDSTGNYSVLATSVTYTPLPVPDIVSIRYSYADTALTSATVTIEWDDIVNSEFNIAYYMVTYNGTTRTVKGNSIIAPADWLGERTFTIKAVDVQNRISNGYSSNVTKLAPNPPTNFRTQVIDNTVMLYWDLPNRTSLPIDHIILKKGTSWNTAESLGEKKGAFTTITEVQGGETTYWVACVDTEGVESTPVFTTTTVSEPPDFVFNGEIFSTYTGTKSNASQYGNTLVLPVNTTETWQSHFTSRSWSTPQDQINAGYPMFIQPTTSAGYYEEVFDFQQPLASSKITMSYRGTTVSGSPTITYRISISLDNSTYMDYDGVTEVFGTNFRYVKIRITVTDSDSSNVDIYSIEDLSVRLDAKLKNDAGSLPSASESDTLGSVVNFNKEFIDVQSVTLSASGTTPISCVYDIKDAFVSGTYSVSSNVCTVNITNHGLITGQKVKLFIGNGSGINGIYTITSYSTNSFTVSMTTTNTTGNISMYPQSFRVYLFNDSGTRVTAPVSWSIKGY